MFNSTHPHLFQVCQQAVIRNSTGAVLILKNPDNLWTLPGGTLGIGEGWHTSFARHLKNQLGIVDFDIKKVLEVDSRDESGETFYTVVFECAVGEFESMVMSKIKTEHAWVLAQNLEKFPIKKDGTLEKLERILGGIPLPPK